MEDRLFMTEKITLTPGEVRGLGNIVSHKTEKNFLPVDCRIHTPQQATVNGVTRDVFLVDMSPAGTLVDTYITVDGPSIVELSDEEITFNVALHRSDGVRVKSVPLVCMTGDSVLEVTSDQYGYAEFTVPNTFTEGLYTFTFASQTIVIQDSVRFDNAYRNHSFVVVGDSGESYFDLLCPDSPIQTGGVAHLISRFCVDGVGIPGSTLYFFEEFTKSVLKGSASLENFVSGETTTLSAELKDTDGSAVQEAPVYFFMEADGEVYAAYLTLSKSRLMLGETCTVTVTAVDSKGYGVPGTIFRFAKATGSLDFPQVTTGADGKATYTYTSTGAGDLTFRAESVNATHFKTSDYVTIEDCYTYGTDISHFLTLEPSIPRISTDGNRITLYSYDADGEDGYASTPVLFDHVFNSDDELLFETTIDTPTDISIVAVAGYPATNESEGGFVIGGHDPRVTSEAGADDPDNTAFINPDSMGELWFISHTFAANDKLIITIENGGAMFDVNDSTLSTTQLPNSQFYIGFMVTNESPQFFKDITIKKI